jgi:serine/threonine protein kinase
MSLGMLGKYERLDILGHGASGIVYLAQDTLLRRRVALKEITAQGEDKRRVLEEARVLDRLRHPNIVAVNGVDTINGKVVIDMEYVPGSNLLDILRESDGPLPLPESIDIARQICDGLAYAHAQRTVHRDIKPANILVSDDHHVKLADFGLAQVLGTNSYAGGAGTFAYMAPEDFEEGDRSDRQSDLWAVGVILYEMLTGRRPFTVINARDPFAWSRAISKDEVQPPSFYTPSVPASVDAICLKALQRKKSDRYNDAADMAYDLSALQDIGPGAKRITIPARESTLGEQKTDVQVAALLGATDIDTFLSTAPSLWEEACETLSSGALSSWLDKIREPLLASVALELSEGSLGSVGNRMRDFLYRAGMELDRCARDDAREGSILISGGSFAAAVEYLQRAVNLDPTHPSYFRLLAQAGSSAGDIDLARETLENGLRRHPQDRSMRRDLAVIGGAKPQLSTSYVNFGQLRHGEVRSLEVVLRSVGTDPVKGRVASAPGWLKITPLSFDAKSRKVLKLTAESGTLPRDAHDYEDKIVIETVGGTIELPVALTLLQTRPSFGAIFYWYMPVLAFCLLPLLFGQFATVATYHHNIDRPLAPAGLIASGILFAAFLAINVEADTRMRERFIAGSGIILLPTGIVMLLSLSQRAPHSLMPAWPIYIETCLPALAVPLLQAVALVKFRETLARYPVWCAVVAVVSSIVSAILWKVGAGTAGVQ